MLNHLAFRTITKSHIMRKTSLSVALALAAATANAQSGRSDYDVDKDGLIEIRSVEDFLAIPGAARGAVKLYDSAAGCPEPACIGYELVSDLDYSDLPNVQLPMPFLYYAIFEGNQHVIKNLKTNLFRGPSFGLFEYVHGSVIRNLKVENVELEAPGAEYLGTLTPLLVLSTIVNVEVSGTLRGRHYTGGLAGVATGSVILDSHFSGTIQPAHVALVEASFGMGGLVGNGENTVIFASSANGKFELSATPVNNFALGGLIGTTHSHNSIIASYANFENVKVNLVGNLSAHPPVTIESSYSIYNADGSGTAAVVGFYSKVHSQGEVVSTVDPVVLADLACPQSELDERCDYPDLLQGWQSHRDSSAQEVWNFGSSTDLPVINEELEFDLTDSDQDGVLDLLDRFPENAAAVVDFDGDGNPDLWWQDCDAQCQEESGLTLDDKVQRRSLPAPLQEDHRYSGSFALFDFWFLLGLNCALLLAGRRNLVNSK
jgi:hypothetical protein